MPGGGFHGALRQALHGKGGQEGSGIEKRAQTLLTEKMATL